MGVVGSDWKTLATENGAAVIASLLSPEEVSQLLRQIEQTPLARSRAGIRHALKHPAVQAIARDPRLQNIADEILGAPSTPFRATLFDKSAGSNWLVVWHQDTALPLRRKSHSEGWGPWSVKDGVNYAHAPTHALEKVLALRLHLDDSTESNGPLRIVPGTHRLGVLADDAVSKIVGFEQNSVSLTATIGDVIAMRPMVIHSSQKAQNGARRRVLHIEYASALEFDGMQLAITG